MGMSEELFEMTQIGDSLEIGADYHPNQDVVTILLSSPEISTAINLEVKKGELETLKEAIDSIEAAYELENREERVILRLHKQTALKWLFAPSLIGEGSGIAGIGRNGR